MKYLYNITSHSRLKGLKFKTFIQILILVCGFSTQVEGQILSPDTISLWTSFTVSHNQTNAVSQLWDFGDGITGTNQTEAHSYSLSSCGYSSKIITLSITDSSSIIHQYQKTIVIKNIVNQPILTDSDPITPFSNCDNSPSLSNPNFSISLNNNTVDTATISYYIVNWGDNSTIDTFYNSSFPISHTYQSLGLFQFSISAVNALGCSSTTLYPIANQSNPAVGLSSLGSTQGCAPQEFTFILSQYQSNSPGTYYVWNFGDGSPQITWAYGTPYINDSIKHIFQTTSCQNGGNSFTVSVTAHNYCDQTTATVSNIRIYTSPVAQFTPSTTTGCKNSSISFNNQTLSGFGYNCNGNASYLWDFGDGSASTQTNPQHSYSASGTYTVVLTASNGVCGISTDTATITINETPKAKFANITTNSCDTLTIFPQNLSTGGNLTYKWIITPTSGWVFQNSTNKYSANPTIKFNQKGIYTVKLRATNNCGIDDTTVVIRIKSKPQIQLGTIQNFCGSGIVSPSVVIDSNNAFIYNYHWTFGNANPTSNNNLAAGFVSYNNPGIQTIHLSATNICGTTTDSTQFEVYALPQVVATTTNPAICKFDSTTLIASGALSYLWKDLNNNTLSLNSSCNISPVTSQNFVVSGTDTNGCINFDTISVQVYNLPQISVNSSQNAICKGDTIQLTANGANSYSWSNSSINIGQGAIIQYNPNQSSWVKVVATDTNGCVSEDSTQIQVFTPPTLSISALNPMICENDSIQIQLSGAQNISINPPIGSIGSSYNFKPKSTTLYQINAYDLAGCNTDTTLTITVEKLPVLSISQSANEICEGDSISFSATGTTNYQWLSNGQNLSSQANFVLQPQISSTLILSGTSANGCKNYDTTSFIVHSLPNVQISSNANAICKGKSVTLTASGANSYQWFKNGNSSSQNVILTDTLFSTTNYKLT
ncbi:MAG: PKD domain-containing protein, partial [Bacteroidales bacterium]|nr:PKD domain-containing protein [Bacteroidales bacterium]